MAGLQRRHDVLYHFGLVFFQTDPQGQADEAFGYVVGDMKFAVAATKVLKRLCTTQSIRRI